MKHMDEKNGKLNGYHGAREDSLGRKMENQIQKEMVYVV